MQGHGQQGKGAHRQGARNLAAAGQDVPGQGAQDGQGDYRQYMTHYAGGQGAQGGGLCPGVFRGFPADIDGKAEIEPVAGRERKM